MVSNENLVRLIQDMEMKLEVMMKWLKDSGLTVNDAKTEVCLFNRGGHAPIALTVNNIQIRSKTTMNVLGVEFDSKLQWSNHRAKAIKKGTTCNQINKRLFHTNGIEKSDNLKLLFYSVLQLWGLVDSISESFSKTTIVVLFKWGTQTVWTMGLDDFIWEASFITQKSKSNEYDEV